MIPDTAPTCGTLVNIVDCLTGREIGVPVSDIFQISQFRKRKGRHSSYDDHKRRQMRRLEVVGAFPAPNYNIPSPIICYLQFSHNIVSDTPAVKDTAASPASPRAIPYSPRATFVHVNVVSPEHKQPVQLASNTTPVVFRGGGCGTSMGEHSHFTGNTAHIIKIIL